MPVVMGGYAMDEVFLLLLARKARRWAEDREPSKDEKGEGEDERRA